MTIKDNADFRKVKNIDAVILITDCKISLLIVFLYLTKTQDILCNNLKL